MQKTLQLAHLSTDFFSLSLFLQTNDKVHCKSPYRVFVSHVCVTHNETLLGIAGLPEVKPTLQ